jgi:hypothetical protein
MYEDIIIALIGGAVAITSGFISSLIGSNKTLSYIERTQAVFDTKLEELTREVREHNNFAKRVPIVEEQVKTINQRLNNAEKQ